jgi:PAS domain S-box-containing protein
MVKLAENTPGAIFEWMMEPEPDHSVHFAFFSAKLPELLGVTHEELNANGAAVFKHIPQEDAVMAKAVIFRAADRMANFEFRHRVNHPVKGPRWVLVSANPTPQANGSIPWYGNTIDITDQMEAERRAAEVAEQLSIAHGRLSSVAEIAPVGLCEYLWLGPNDVRFTYTSAKYEDLIGYSREEIAELQGRVIRRIHEDDQAQYIDELNEASRYMVQRQKRFRIHHPTRGLRWLSTVATPRKSEDGIVVWTGALIDVTADVEREAKLKQLHETAEAMRAENERHALHDGLTGLPNRRYYDRMLMDRLSRAERGEAQDCALIRLDLDHFKYVNDTLGHEAGDLVLVCVAEILRSHLRASDFAAHYQRDGNCRFQKAHNVVVAGYSIETPRLLLNSAGPEHPDGLANSSGTVGRFLMVHLNDAVWTTFDEEIRWYKGPPSMACSENFNYFDDVPGGGFARDFDGGYGFMSQGPLPGDFATTLVTSTGLIGEPLVEKMMLYNRMAGLKMVGETIRAPNSYDR